MDDDVAAFLDLVPEEYVLADPDDLSGTVTLADDDPTPVERARTLLADASSIELLTPTIPDAILDELTGRVLDGGTTIDAVATGRAGDSLTSGPLAAAQPMLMGRSDVSLSLHGGDAPVAVLLRPDLVAFAVPDGENGLAALFESAGEHARSWARDVYDTYEGEADELV